MPPMEPEELNADGRPPRRLFPQEALLARIRSTLPGLIAFYVFGSRVTGGTTITSDLDLAVLVDGTVDPLTLWRLAGELADIADCEVDLVDLRAASTVMQHQIVTTGRRLWAQDGRAGLYEAFILSEKTALDEARAGVLEDIQREGTIYGR